MQSYVFLDQNSELLCEDSICWIRFFVENSSKWNGRLLHMYNRFLHTLWGTSFHEFHRISKEEQIYSLFLSPECFCESTVSILFRAISCFLQRIYKRARIKRFRFSARNTRHVKKYLFPRAQIAYPVHKFQALEKKTSISDFIQNLLF